MSDLEAASRKINFTDLAMILVVLVLPHPCWPLKPDTQALRFWNRWILAPETRHQGLPKWIIMSDPSGKKSRGGGSSQFCDLKKHKSQ